MYTVVRFTSEFVPRDVFDRLGGALNQVLPGAFTGLRHAGDGFACEIADSDRWENHRAAILVFIDRAGPTIGEALQGGVDVCVDVAIEPEDMQEALVLSIVVDPGLAGRLAETGVTLTLSFYRAGNA